MAPEGFWCAFRGGVVWKEAMSKPTEARLHRRGGWGRPGAWSVASGRSRGSGSKRRAPIGARAAANAAGAQARVLSPCPGAGKLARTPECANSGRESGFFFLQAGQTIPCVHAPPRPAAPDSSGFRDGLDFASLSGPAGLDSELPGCLSWVCRAGQQTSTGLDVQQPVLIASSPIGLQQVRHAAVASSQYCMSHYCCGIALTNRPSLGVLQLPVTTNHQTSACRQLDCSCRRDRWEPTWGRGKKPNKPPPSVPRNNKPSPTGGQPLDKQAFPRDPRRHGDHHRKSPSSQRPPGRRRTFSRQTPPPSYLVSCGWTRPHGPLPSTPTTWSPGGRAASLPPPFPDLTRSKSFA